PPTSPLFPYTTLFRSLGTVDPLTGYAQGDGGTQWHPVPVIIDFTSARCDQPSGSNLMVNGGFDVDISSWRPFNMPPATLEFAAVDRKSTRLNSSHLGI